MDLEQVLTLSTDMPTITTELSDTTRLLAIAMLQSLCWRGSWSYGDDPLTDEQWDVADALTSLAVEEILKEVTVSGGTMPIGTIFIWPTDDEDDLPDGCYFCRGQEIFIHEHTALWNLIGTIYGPGSVESDLMTLPDLQQRVPVGVLDTLAIGNTGGAKTHTLTTDEMPVHSHGVNRNVWVVESSELNLGAGSYWGSYTADLVAAAGGSGPHNNMQPYLVLNYAIKAREEGQGG